MAREVQIIRENYEIQKQTVLDQTSKQKQDMQVEIDMLDLINIK